MYRTILFQILSKRTDLIRAIFPETWSALYEEASETYSEEMDADKQRAVKREDLHLVANDSHVIVRLWKR